MSRKFYFSLCLSAIGVIAMAQTQRLVLVEEFTQASCGPCAAANPSLNNLLANNASKCVSIKYQVSWPGVDPMNAQYPSPIATRVNFYNVTGVPYALMDGVAVTGASYVGHPSNLNASKINNEYAVPAPFSINVSHFLNAAQDSISISATFTAAQNFTSSGSVRGFLMLVEKHISFASPPGSNGETDFYMVCRRMYPGQAGAVFPTTWNSGDDTTLSIKALLPTYIYDINQLAVVCFIQDNGNKAILQAGYSISPVGIENPVQTASIINLFPNPANEKVTLSFVLQETADVAINIYSLTGEMILSQNKGQYPPGKQEMEITVEMLANGMYMVELVTGSQKATRRLHVNH